MIYLVILLWLLLGYYVFQDFELEEYDEQWHIGVYRAVIIVIAPLYTLVQFLIEIFCEFFMPANEAADEDRIKKIEFPKEEQKEIVEYFQRLLDAANINAEITWRSNDSEKLGDEGNEKILGEGNEDER